LADPRGDCVPLLDRRLAIVTGKGGTGKTTVAAALAWAAAQRGLRVLVTEVGRDPHVPRLLAPDAPAVGYQEREIVPGIAVMRIDPFAALAEYLGLQIGMPGLVERVVRNRGFRQLMEAAPGWRALITLGKVWHLAQMRRGDGPKYDLIVVDAPATGHGMTFLDVPRVVAAAVRAGPLRHHTQQVEALIADRERTLLLPVALAEELPVRETVALVRRVREELSVHVDRVIVNAVHAPPYDASLGALDERLAELPGGLELASLPPPAVLARCARHLSARARLNRHHAGAIRERTGLPTVELPYLAAGVRGVEDLARLAGPLLGEAEARR
jgi:anion-transporting  ArsA/GET3 family ATPase